MNDIIQKILIVDDNDTHLRLIAKVLAMEGYQVFTAQNAEATISSIAENKPNLVILDVVMPGTNGYELCKILRQAPYNMQLPIVMLTAVQGEDERKLAKEAGANAVWSKPFDIDVVRENIAILLGDRQDQGSH